MKSLSSNWLLKASGSTWLEKKCPVLTIRNKTHKIPHFTLLRTKAVRQTMSCWLLHTFLLFLSANEQHPNPLFPFSQSNMDHAICIHQGEIRIYVTHFRTVHHSPQINIRIWYCQEIFRQTIGSGGSCKVTSLRLISDKPTLLNKESAKRFLELKISNRLY